MTQMVGETAKRNTAMALVWTTHREPLAPADLADDLTGRGFVPGVTDADATHGALSEAGLADVTWQLEGPALRFVSLSSSRGQGVAVRLEEADARHPVPDHPAARPVGRRGGVVYVIEALGPGNSDRNLCENLAEAVMERVDGVVEIKGRGVKGNRPVVYVSPWLGIYAD